MCSAKNLYSAIDSSSIINIDLTSNTDLALGRSSELSSSLGLRFRQVVWRNCCYGKRMQRQINNFFSAFSVVIYASGWTFWAMFMITVERILH